MGILKHLGLLLLFLCFVLFGRHYKALVPLHDIPAGTVIEDADLRTGEFWSLRAQDYATERSLVVGRRASKLFARGTRYSLLRPLLRHQTLSAACPGSLVSLEIVH